MVITERDIAILQAIARHRFLRSTHLATLFAEAPGAKIVRRLHKLYHNGYLDRPRTQIDYHLQGGGSKPIVCGLTNRGERLLAEHTGSNPKRRDTKATRLFLDHTLEVADFMVALERSCQVRGDIRLIYPEEILANASEKVKGQRNPFMWETRVRWGGEEHRIHVAPDKVFGLEMRDGSSRFYFLEADRGTMPVARSDLRRTSLLRKFLSYGATHHDRTHSHRFGFGHFQVLFVVPSNDRAASCIETCRDCGTGSGNRGLLLFSTHANLTDQASVLESTWIDVRGCTVCLILKLSMVFYAQHSLHFYCANVKYGLVKPYSLLSIISCVQCLR